ncbi:MAG: rhomboid family intramembrane serine protease [Gemmatimonadaceae bacterium]|nr:rhomboid family intramembrane serine protease [Gemmatimonadaceae bacterium]
MINETYEVETESTQRHYPAVKWLLALNIAVFTAQVAFIEPERLFGLLGLSPENFPAAWWTIVTYMFVHVGPLHLALNMATLWMFGSRLESAWNTKSFAYFYLWCGIGGAIAHLLFARDVSLVGASAGVSGVLMAYGLRWPEDRVYLFGFIPTKSRWLVLWMIAINIAIGISPQTQIGWKAHLGGLAFGWLFLHAGSLTGNDVRRWVASIPDEPDGMPSAVPKTRISTREKMADIDDAIAHGSTSRVNAERVNAEVDEDSLRARLIDRVLDKISNGGLGSLTREERAILDDTSRKLRRGDNSSHS